MSDTEAMEEGRELDARIAEQIMGFMAVRVDRDRQAAFNSVYGADGICHTVPHYSTDIADAWTVVKKMEERGFHARVTTPFRPDEEHFAGFTPHGMSGWNGRPDFYAGGRTAPLAICRAALAAVRSPIGAPDHG